MKEDRQLFWSEMFKEHRAALKGYFRRRVFLAEEADDLAQEVYLRLIKIENEKGAFIRNAEAYLYTVAVNLVRERAASQKRRPVNIAIDFWPEMALTEVTPEVAYERRDKEKRLGEVISKLSPKLRSAIILHYQHEMSFEEIAEELGVTAHAIKKNITRGLQICRHNAARYKKYMPSSRRG